MNFQTDWTTSDGILWSISGDYKPGTPAKTSGHPDSWYPAEGSEVEVQSVTNQSTGEKMDFDDWLEEYGYDDVDVEEIYEQIDQDMADYSEAVY